jgi:organic hydroperoxide reductase OsmC/OhrA
MKGHRTIDNMQPTNPLIDSGKPLFFRLRAAPVQLGTPPVQSGDAVRVAVRSLSAMQKEALVAAARSGDVWRLASDEGAYLAGLDEAPCPLAFFTSGMVSATLNALLALARQQRIPVARLRLVQDNYYTMTGSALQGSMRGGARDPQLVVQWESTARRSDLEQLVSDAVAASPISGLLRTPMQSQFSLTHNDQLLLPSTSAQPGPVQPDPRSEFDRAQPNATDWRALVRRGGLTPKAAHSVTLAGDSLAPNQNRLLHVRGICTLRDDGVKQIEVQLFNPHGSVFNFLSDEAVVNGGGGRAPDALGLASAGIAFCFMTQLGRYASITRRKLRDYSIVQDTHFCGGTAAPVTTHVHLHTDESDASARRMLEMAEQTCFLHALCKATLSVQCEVQSYSDAIPEPRLPQ